MATKTAPRKKAEVLADKAGIEAYCRWLQANPKASRRRRISTFDAMVDSAQLQLKING